MKRNPTIIDKIFRGAELRQCAAMGIPFYLSARNYDKRRIPTLRYTCDCDIKGVWQQNGDEYETYHYGYDTMIDAFKRGLIKWY